MSRLLVNRYVHRKSSPAPWTLGPGGAIIALLLALAGAPPVAGQGTVLFQEPFEDTNFTSRGWYDGTGGTLSSVEHIPGSTKSFECHFMVGGTVCSGGTPLRHGFTESESVYISFWIKFSTNWTGSNRPYHPHLHLFMTNKNGAYDGPAWTHLTTYVEDNEGTPLVAIQDGTNINKKKIGGDLTGVTENRAVAGCNGDSDGYGNGDCYRCRPNWCNGKAWKTNGVFFSDNPGLYYKSDWHHIEAYFKLNTISNGIGQRDGVLQYGYDGVTLIDIPNAVIRTGQYPDMKFNQYLLAPYIGDGSPIDQTFWIDDLLVATAKP